MFAPAFAPLVNPEAIVNSKLALAFLDAGWHVDIISRNLAEEGQAHSYGSSWNEPWTALRDRTHIVTCKGLVGRRQWLYRAWNCVASGFPLDHSRWGMHAFDHALKLHCLYGYDVIISRALPDSAHIPAIMFSRKTGIPWIANWNDPPCAKMPDPDGQGENASLGFFYERLLRAVANRAHALTFPCERLKRYICAYLPIGSAQKSWVIPHVSLQPGSVELSAARKVFSLCHAGNLYNGRQELFVGVIKVLGDSS